MKKLSAFILAAGLGERLRPITDHIPKPLLPVLGRPIIESVAEKIDQLAPEIICINMHHKWERIKDWTERSRFASKARLFYEKERLGTGGAFKNAEASLKDSHFIAHNADILSDIDLKRLVDIHISSGNIATLAIHDFERFNNIWVDSKGFLKHVGEKGEVSGLCKMAFMGIAVYSPEFLSYLPEGESSVVDAWLNVLRDGHTIGTIDYTGCRWTDIGTPDAYAEAVFDALKNDGEAIYLGDTYLCNSLGLAADAVIERGVCFEGAAQIGRSIILPGAVIKEASCLSNSIEGPGFSVRLKKRLIKPESFYLIKKSDQLEITETGSGGSDRRYYRVRAPGSSFVLMKCSETDREFTRQIALTRFLKKYNMPVPELFEEDAAHKEALLEDLGDITLYAWLKCRRSHDDIEKMYMEVLNIAASLHTIVSAHIEECPCILERIFDIEHFRWETDYFIERFLKETLGITIDNEDLLRVELHSLAELAASFNKSIVHRDFQSQNIMVQNSKARLIDYQGIRLGPSAYDIASMLWDPYHNLDNDMRERLIDYYIGHRKAKQQGFDEQDFMRSLLPCRLQRHMQALGAYGFLSKVKGKLYFIKHIPVALQYLKEEIETVKETYPLLYGLISRL